MSKGEKRVARIIDKLRGGEVELSKGQTNVQVCKKVGVTEQTFTVGVRSMES